MSRSQKRRYRRTRNYRVGIIKEISEQELRTKRIASVVAAAGLEEARREAEAAKEHAQQRATGQPPGEVSHA
ncbi:hypothetical protein EG850_12210 [Gulosibacter macacae]|uniref:Uncharacterized protein n=1 Tax=Gulosibacter macacae TaxID=2488791 RepID=A0A3P3VW53_9MICO|nr:hypothetical protein [Gulosibacter macacae]RRJ85679.1 hypothetical protein EG850_12210 [Gulosibacter macacae]